MTERYRCSLVCWNWNSMFDSPRPWRKFVMTENSFRTRRFNLFSGFEMGFSHNSFQSFLGCVGRYIRHLTVLPLNNFHTLGKFLHILDAFIGFFDEYPMPSLESFSFTLACETRGVPGWDEPIINGTGGQILNSLKSVIGQLQNLDSLTLNQLLLDSQDAPDLLTKFHLHNRENLHYLELVNCTKNRYPMFHAAMFPNLSRLVITPQQLNNDVLLMAVENTSLMELVLVQDQYTPATDTMDTVHFHVWWEVKQINPFLRVRLEAARKGKEDILLQENAPVYQIVYSSPYQLLNQSFVIHFWEHYRLHLEVFAHLGLPKRFGSRSFHDRGDSSYVSLVRECPNLHTLVIRERVSSATVFIIAREARSLKNFHVRENAVLIKSDWPKPPEWSDEEYERLQSSARSRELLENSVSGLLKQEWKLLSDKMFKSLSY